jgi:hypothetical protein
MIMFVDVLLQLIEIPIILREFEHKLTICWSLLIFSAWVIICFPLLAPIAVQYIHAIPIIIVSLCSLRYHFHIQWWEYIVYFLPNLFHSLECVLLKLRHSLEHSHYFLFIINIPSLHSVSIVKPNILLETINGFTMILLKFLILIL